ncbi:hypothetical protein [Holdemanella biformis]|uniref:hypothetical protein n=1 Tax=Holdemanella biformis TaxID=1735 RepID=UPI00216B4BA5|nr:hypothetical protein [Holdemanella biformis]
MIEAYRLIDKLEREHALSLLEYQTLIETENEALRLYASNKAKEVANSIYGNSVYVRGLIEVGTIVVMTVSIVVFENQIPIAIDIY